MIMKTGIDLFKIRPLGKNDDLHRLESNYNIKIPPIYRLFNETFQRDFNLMEGENFYYYPELSGGEITFPFKSIEDSIKSTIGSSDEELIDRKLLLVATNRFGFYLGTIKEDSDKIFTKIKSIEGTFKIVADNIFEFLRGVTDNLSDAAESEEQYRQFLVQLGFEGDELENEVNDWKVYKNL